MSGFEPLTVRLQGEPERYLDVARYGLMGLLAGITVALYRLTSLGDWQRWLPEWLPEPGSPSTAWLRKCSPEATIGPGHARSTRRLPGPRPSGVSDVLALASDDRSSDSGRRATRAGGHGT